MITEPTSTWNWTVDGFANVSYYNWWQGSATEPAEPNNSYRGAAVEDCVEMSLEGTWNDQICRCSDLDPAEVTCEEELRPVLCEQETEPEPPVVIPPFPIFD